jgi:ketosteroid isomerase-like protein
MQAFYAEAVSISKQNVEWIREAGEAWDRGDMEAFEALLEGHVAPDAQFDPLYLDRVYGVGEVRQLWADMTEVWQDYRSDIEEVVDLGEHVLVVSHITGRGAQGGVPVDQRICFLCRFDGDKLLAAKSFASRREALEAVGLRE